MWDFFIDKTYTSDIYSFNIQVYSKFNNNEKNTNENINEKVVINQIDNLFSYNNKKLDFYNIVNEIIIILSNIREISKSSLININYRTSKDNIDISFQNFKLNNFYKEIFLDKNENLIISYCNRKSLNITYKDKKINVSLFYDINEENINDLLELLSNKLFEFNNLINLENNQMNKINKTLTKKR